MRVYTYLFCFIFILPLVGCSDFLEESPKGQLTSGSLFGSLDDLNMSVYALYGKVVRSQTNTNTQIPQWQGDDITTHPASNKDAYREFDRYLATDVNKGTVESWQHHYEIIKAANNIILNAEKTPTSQEEINIAMGQAYYWRAYSYFVLVRIFGKLPLSNDGLINPNRTLSEISDVYNTITTDLNRAIDILPTSYSQEPRKVNGSNAYITKQAAQSTLVAVYMAMGGYPLNQPDAYAKAATLAKTVIDGVNSGTYEYILEPNFKDVYSISKNYTNETVVGINYNQSFGAWSAQASQLSSTQMLASTGGGWNDCVGEIRFWKNYPEGARKDAVYSQKVRLNDGTQVDWWETSEKQPVFSIFTFSNQNGMQVDLDLSLPYYTGMTDGIRHRVIRYAEVLLWYAESQARADGTPNDFAYQCVNKVRQRAGLTDLQAGLDGTTFANLVATEHGWEVAGNYDALVTRRADQLRLNLLKSSFEDRAKNESFEVSTGIILKDNVEIQNTAWNDAMIYAPIPNIDASLNNNL